jgi:AcrR family transcriptional regulator
MKSMSPRKRGQQGTSLLEAIKTAAWRQISSKGAAALSLRAIARELGITAPTTTSIAGRTS